MLDGFFGSLLLLLEVRALAAPRRRNGFSRLESLTQLDVRQCRGFRRGHAGEELAKSYGLRWSP